MLEKINIDQYIVIWFFFLGGKLSNIGMDL